MLCYKSIELNDKIYYICVIIDIFSRKVIAYKISLKSSTQLITTTFKKAYIDRGAPHGTIFHSDRGSQYTAQAFRKLLNDRNIIQSFSKSGHPHDNAVAESFFSTLRKEELFRMRYRSEREFYKGLEDYIEFYNDKRPHSTIRYITPNKFEALYMEKQSY